MRPDGSSEEAFFKLPYRGDATDGCTKMRSWLMKTTE